MGVRTKAQKGLNSNFRTRKISIGTNLVKICKRIIYCVERLPQGSLSTRTAVQSSGDKPVGRNRRKLPVIFLAFNDALESFYRAVIDVAADAGRFVQFAPAGQALDFQPFVQPIL